MMMLNEPLVSFIKYKQKMIIILSANYNKRDLFRERERLPK